MPSRIHRLPHAPHAAAALRSGDLRLGYACLNTRLPTASATCRLSNATPARLEALGRANLVALERIVRWNVEREIRLFRISSNTIPFASHPHAVWPWSSRLRPELRRIGRLLADEGVRVSMHPSQYIVLNSPSAAVRRAARAELVYHGELLSALGTDAASKIVLHVGGAYGDRVGALATFTREVNRLPNDVRTRLALENDDAQFTLEDVLGLSRQTGLPVVLDLFHHEVLPSLRGADAAVLARLASATWDATDGRPKVHVSRQARGRRRGAHAGSLPPRHALPLLDVLAAGIAGDRARRGPLGRGLDVMLETKDKERSVLALYRSLRDVT